MAALFSVIVSALPLAPQRQALYMLRVLRAALVHLLYAPVSEQARLLAQLLPGTAVRRAADSAARNGLGDEAELRKGVAHGPTTDSAGRGAAAGGVDGTTTAVGDSMAAVHKVPHDNREATPVFAQLADLALEAALRWFTGAGPPGHSNVIAHNAAFMAMACAGRPSGD